MQDSGARRATRAGHGVRWRPALLRGESGGVQGLAAQRQDARVVISAPVMRCMTVTLSCSCEQHSCHQVLLACAASLTATPHMSHDSWLGHVPGIGAGLSLFQG